METKMIKIEPNWIINVDNIKYIANLDTLTEVNNKDNIIINVDFFNLDNNDKTINCDIALDDEYKKLLSFVEQFRIYVDSMNIEYESLKNNNDDKYNKITQLINSIKVSYNFFEAECEAMENDCSAYVAIIKNE